MKKKYQDAKLPFDVLPNYGLLYCQTVRGYRVQKQFERRFKLISNVLDAFYDIVKEK
jgi:hypothetical protein